MNLDAFKQHRFESQTVQYTDRDTILYALSVGAGADPLDPLELPLIYEQGLSALPSLAAVIAHPGAWITEEKFAVDWVRLLHGEQRLECDRPLPATTSVRAEYRIIAVDDKGKDKGALVYFEKQLFNRSDDERLCTVTSTYFLRADGGSGGFGHAPEPLQRVPEREPDLRGAIQVSPGAAALYRLNGDRNPIHIDPSVARRAGFDVPILHGLCTYGICGHWLVRNCFAGDTSRMRSLDVRFTAPVIPGETLHIEAWKQGDGFAFQASVQEREVTVISNGFSGRR